MKKLLSTFALLFGAALSFAITLPTGQETVIRDQKTENGKIIAVVLGAPVTFKTVFGDVEAKANTRVDFYESGALKFFYSDAHCDVTTSAGTFKLTTFHSTRPGVGVPFEFYENGNLKTAFFSRQAKPVVKTPLGDLQAMQATKVTFFENGEVESFCVAPNQKINFKNLTGSFVQQKVLSFYENGSIKSLTSNADELCQPLGIKAKKSTEITFSESGNMISFTPADGSTVKIGDLMFLLCRGKEFALFDNGSIKKCTVDVSKQDFTIGNTTFAYKTAMENAEQDPSVAFVPTAYLTLRFAENGTLLSATADKIGASGEAFPIVGGIGGRLWSAKSLEYYDDGSLFCIDYIRALPIGKRLRPNILIALPQGYTNIDASVAPAVKITKQYLTYEIWKSYFSKDGMTEYLVGQEVTESPKSNLYDEAATGIFVLKGGSITKSMYLSDVTGSSKILFDESSNPASYTVAENSGESEITKSIEDGEKETKASKPSNKPISGMQEIF